MFVYRISRLCTKDGNSFPYSKKYIIGLTRYDTCRTGVCIIYSKGLFVAVGTKDALRSVSSRTVKDLFFFKKKEL